MAAIDIKRFEEYLNITYQDSPRTRDKYLEIANRFIKYVGTEFNNDTIRQFFSSPNIRRNNQPIKNNAINRATMNVIATSLNLEKEINVPISKSRDKKKDLKFLTQDQIRYIINNTTNEVSIRVRLMFETGLRLFEITNLQRNKIDLENNEVSGKGKGNKDFRLDFSDETNKFLKEYLSKNDNEFPFRYNNKVDYPEKKFQYELKKACSNFKFGVITPHKIRHSLGHYLRVDLGLDLEQVRYALRHESVETTQIYSTAAGEEVRKKIKENFLKI